MEFEKVLELIKTDDDFQKFLNNPNDKKNQMNAIESMYNFIGSEAYNEGRRSMEKEWKEFSDNQQQQLDVLKKMAEILKIDL